MAERSEITYSLTNVFTRKREEVVMRTFAENDPQPGLSIDYLDVFRLRLAQSYDFDEAERNDQTDRYERRPFSDLLADATMQLDTWISLNNKTWFSFYLGEVTEHAHTLTLSVPNWVQTSFGFDFVQKVNEYKRKHRSELKRFWIWGWTCPCSAAGAWAPGTEPTWKRKKISRLL